MFFTGGFKYSTLMVEGGNDEVKQQVKRYISKYIADYRITVKGKDVYKRQGNDSGSIQRKEDKNLSA